MFEDIQYIEKNSPYTVLSYIENDIFENKLIKIHIPNEDEYVEIVQKRGGTTLNNPRGYGSHLATSGEIRKYYFKIKNEAK